MEYCKGDSSKQRLHFRVLVLDSDKDSQKSIKKSFLSTFKDGDIQVNFEDSTFFYVSTLLQFNDITGFGGFNTIWINTNFPDCYKISERIYHESPFSYQVFYGEGITLSKKLFRSRPIGYIHQLTNVQEVHREMSFISSCFKREQNMLKLSSRSSFLMVPYHNILYLQSSGRKSYIYLGALNNGVCEEDDIYVKRTDSSKEIFAYVQNRKLDEIYMTLESARFVRVHKSYIINRDYIVGLRKSKYGWLISLRDSKGIEVQIPVSDPYHNIVDEIAEKNYI